MESLVRIGLRDGEQKLDGYTEKIMCAEVSKDIGLTEEEKKKIFELGEQICTIIAQSMGRGDDVMVVEDLRKDLH